MDKGSPVLCGHWAQAGSLLHRTPPLLGPSLPILGFPCLFCLPVSPSVACPQALQAVAGVQQCSHQRKSGAFYLRGKKKKNQELEWRHFLFVFPAMPPGRWDCKLCPVRHPLEHWINLQERTGLTNRRAGADAALKIISHLQGVIYRDCLARSSRSLIKTLLFLFFNLRYSAEKKKVMEETACREQGCLTGSRIFPSKLVALHWCLSRCFGHGKWCCWAAMWDQIDLSIPGNWGMLWQLISLKKVQIFLGNVKSFLLSSNLFLFCWIHFVFKKFRTVFFLYCEGKNVVFLCFPSYYLRPLSPTFFSHWMGTEEAWELHMVVLPLWLYGSKFFFW